MLLVHSVGIIGLVHLHKGCPHPFQRPGAQMLSPTSHGWAWSSDRNRHQTPVGQQRPGLQVQQWQQRFCYVCGYKCTHLLCTSCYQAALAAAEAALAAAPAALAAQAEADWRHQLYKGLMGCFGIMTTPVEQQHPGLQLQQWQQRFCYVCGQECKHVLCRCCYMAALAAAQAAALAAAQAAPAAQAEAGWRHQLYKGYFLRAAWAAFFRGI